MRSTTTALTLLALLPALALGQTTDSSGKTIKEGQTYADPQGGARRLHPYGRSDLCVGPGTVPAKDGVTVGVLPCRPNDDTEYGNTQFWQVPAEGTDGQLKLDGTDLCLDSLDVEAKGGAPIKLTTCGSQWTQMTKYENEQFQFGGGEKIGVAPVHCLSVVVEGNAASGGHVPITVYRQLMVWQCTDGLKNLQFSLYDGADHDAGQGGDASPTDGGGATSLPTGSDSAATSTTDAGAPPTTETNVTPTDGSSKTCVAKRAVTPKV